MCPNVPLTVVDRVNQRNDLKVKLTSAESNVKRFEAEYQDVQREIMEVASSNTADRKVMLKDLNQRKTTIGKAINSGRKDIGKLQTSLKSADLLYEPDAKNFHHLDGEMTGRAAMDVPDQNGNRGTERVIFRKDPELFKKTGKMFVYEGHTDDHKYENQPARSRYDPFDAVNPERLVDVNKKIDEDDDDD